MFYNVILTIHSIVRWLVILTATIAFGRALSGLLGKKTWSALDDQWDRIFLDVLDIQVAAGGILYFFASPITAAVFRNLGVVAQNPALRYFTLDHALMMVLAMMAAHIGRNRSRNAADDRKKFQQAALWYGLAIVLILAAIPWPFLAVGRPLLRWG